MTRAADRLRITRYEWTGGSEAMLRFGDHADRSVVIALPLFEEANRTRAAFIDVARRLATRGIAAALPDLPGTGESELPTAAATLATWRTAFAAACAQIAGEVYVVACRGGALVDVDADAAGRWYLAPQSGAAVRRELSRLRQTGGGEDFGGNHLSPAFLDELAGQEPSITGRLRVVRLDSDPRAADRKLAGPPLWRASEPGGDAGLQAAIADDVATWIGA